MKRRLRIVGWALGLSLAMAGIGAAVGASQGAPVEAAAEIEYHTFTIGWGAATSDDGAYENFAAANGDATVETGEIISFSGAKNGASNVPAYNSTNKDFRLYYASNGNGCSVTFDLSGFDYPVTAVSFVSTTNPSVKYSADGGAQTNVPFTGTQNPYTYSLSGLSASSSLTFQNVNTDNVQLRFKKITFTYAVEVEKGVAESVEIAGEGTPYTGETFQLSATVHYKGTKADDNRVTWERESGDSTISSTGLVTVIGDQPSVMKAIAVDKGEGGVNVETTYTVTPVANPITNIVFDTSEAKTKYYTKDSLVITGITATATYTSGNTKGYTLAKSNFSGFDSSNPAPKQTITIMAEENEKQFSTTYDIEIVQLPTLKFGTDYNKITSSSQNFTDEAGNDWAFAAVFPDGQTESFTFDPDYSQIGSGNKTGKWVSSLSLGCDLGENPLTIKSLSIKLGGFSGESPEKGKTTGNVSILVDGVEKATGSLNGTDDVVVSLPQIVRGSEITISLTGLNRLKIYHVDYVAMTDAECVADFIDNYMHMDDYTENLGYCKDVSHHYYADAKAAFNALLPEQRALFASEATYADARARLQNWAAANGDVFDVNNTLVKAYQGTFGGLTNNDPTAFAVAGLIGGMLLATGIGVLVIRRKKQK